MSPQLRATPARSPAAPLPLVRRSPPRPGPVYDAFWRFACERQAIYHRRVRGLPPPWTTDQVLREYKFTNAYRAADRVSQYLIGRVIYAGEESARDTLLRVLLFKIFNNIPTWELMERALGGISAATFDVAALDQVLADARAGGAAIYSAAYIMPSGPALLRRDSKHRMHLELLAQMLAGGFLEKLLRATSLRALYEQLHAVPGLGPFLAFQYAIDMNYAPLFLFSEMEFVVPGPGALDGLSKCFESFGDYSPADVIAWMTERQGDEFAARGLAFQDLFGRDLQLVDIQNLCCEVSKATRAYFPEVVGVTGRTKIKQRYTRSDAPLPAPWFPPFWGINSAADRACPASRLGALAVGLFD